MSSLSSSGDEDDEEWEVVQLGDRELPKDIDPVVFGYVFHKSPFSSSFLDTHFKIEPTELWDSMEAYARCLVNTQYYSKGDFVFVNHKTKEELELVDATSKSTPRDFWVAKILEIKAIDDCSVFASIVWLYWPEDLPAGTRNVRVPGTAANVAKGRRSYHGEHELIASNHIDVVNVCSFAGVPTVDFWDESRDELEMKGLYWRQMFNKCTKELTKLRAHCVCNGNYNPDKLVVACPSCKVWLHERCIVAAVLLMNCRSTTGYPNITGFLKEFAGERKRGKRVRRPWAGRLTGKLLPSGDGQPYQVEVTSIGDAEKIHDRVRCMNCGKTVE